MDLFAPQIKITTEQYSFSQGVELAIYSSADTCYDWAKLRFVSPFEQMVTIGLRERVSIALGYNDQYETVFTGYATSDFVTGTYGNEVILKDAMLLLEAVSINNTFLRVTPQEVVRYAANLAGISKLQLDPTGYPPLACLPIFRQNGIQAIQSLGAQWRIHPAFFFQEDVLYWGTAATQSKVYHFEYGKNIIRLERSDGYWELETVSVPFVKHSQRIQVTHPRISGSFQVSRVRVNTQQSGFIRTTLYFKGA